MNIADRIMLRRVFGLRSRTQEQLYQELVTEFQNDGTFDRVTDEFFEENPDLPRDDITLRMLDEEIEKKLQEESWEGWMYDRTLRMDTAWKMLPLYLFERLKGRTR